MQLNWKAILEALLHLGGWLLCFWILRQAFSFESVEIQAIDGREVEIRTIDRMPGYFFALSLSVKALLFYLNAFWLFPRFFRNRKWRTYLLEVLALLAAILVMEAVLHSLFRQWLPGYRFNLQTSFTGINFLLYLGFLGASFAYRFGKQWQLMERARRQLTQEKLQAELDFLKAQVNPHFLFNTLNNLYAEAAGQQQAKLANSIAGLSDLMRYMLYDGKAEQVPLERELQALEDAVDLYQLRLSGDDDVTISFTRSGPIEDKMIAPLLLLPFVENAFKHGIQYPNPGYIKIRAEATEHGFTFAVANSKFPKKERIAEHSGIGLTNVQRRLELLYPHSHQLQIDETADHFSVHLSLDYD